MKLNMRRHAVAIATTLIAITICILTLIPMPTVANAVPGSDKSHHIIAFAALTGPTALFYRQWIIWVLPGAVMLGGMIELIQPFVGRTASLMDFYADCVGAILGVVVGRLLYRSLRKRLKL